MKTLADLLEENKEELQVDDLPEDVSRETIVDIAQYSQEKINKTDESDRPFVAVTPKSATESEIKVIGDANQIDRNRTTYDVNLRFYLSDKAGMKNFATKIGTRLEDLEIVKQTDFFVTIRVTRKDVGVTPKNNFTLVSSIQPIYMTLYKMGIDDNTFEQRSKEEIVDIILNAGESFLGGLQQIVGILLDIPTEYRDNITILSAVNAWTLLLEKHPEIIAEVDSFLE